MSVVRILGVDPGSRLTGFGVVDLIGNSLQHVAHGTLKLSNTSGKAVIPLERRLLLIHQGLTEVIEKHRPQVMAIERVFFAKNAVSALKLGQARGAAIVTGAIHGLEIVEYSPSEIKAAITGHGAADKQQVAKMVEFLIGKREFATSDASDALGIAICHAHTLGASGRVGPQAAALHSLSAGRRGRRKMSLAEALGLGGRPSQGRGK